MNYCQIWKILCLSTTIFAIINHRCDCQNSSTTIAGLVNITKKSEIRVQNNDSILNWHSWLFGNKEDSTTGTNEKRKDTGSSSSNSIDSSGKILDAVLNPILQNVPGIGQPAATANSNPSPQTPSPIATSAPPATTTTTIQPITTNAPPTSTTTTTTPSPPTTTTQHYYQVTTILYPNEMLKPIAQAGVCPCIKKGSQYVCAAYNPQYQAATLEEAILNFIDTTSSDPKKAQTLNPQSEDGLTPTTATTNLNCNSQGCRSCAKKILDQIFAQVYIAPDSAARNMTMLEIADLYAKVGIGPSWKTKKGECKSKTIRPELTRLPSATASQLQRFGNCISHINNNSASRSSRNTSNRVKTGNNVPFNLQTDDQTNHQRRQNQKRSIGSEFQYTWSINCINRGDPIDSFSNWVGLCDMCWKWGMLTSDFFPQYVNMQRCGDSTRCLSGWGTCKERETAIKVLKKNVEYPMNVPTSCECQIQSGSALQSFIRG